MFNFNSSVIDKVLNPLKITKNSVIEFKLGDLRGMGLWRFKKIIEFKIGDKFYSRYIITSKLEDDDRILEVFPGNNGQLETYVYSVTDTVSFSEEFLDVAGQLFLTTPDGNEYKRCIMPDNEERIDGLRGSIKVYNLETNELERESQVNVWDYQREIDGKTEFLNVEMAGENGMFRIFKGEIIEDIFYNFYQDPK